MAETTEKKPRRVSLALKLNLVTIGVILVLAIGIITIFFTNYMHRINEIYSDTISRTMLQVMKDISKDLDFSLAGVDYSGVRHLSTLFDNPEFEEVRRKALESGDDTAIDNWLLTQPSGVSFRITPDEFRKLAEDLRNSSVNSAETESFIRENSMAGEYQRLYDILFYCLTLSDLDRMTILVPRGDELVVLAECDPDHSGWIMNWANFGRAEHLNRTKEKPDLMPAEFVNNGEETVLRAFLSVDSDSSTDGFVLLAEFNMTTVLHEYNSFMLRSMAFVAALILLTILINIFLTRRLATRPLRRLAQGAQQFGKGGEGYTREDIIQLPIRSSDEIGELYRDIKDMQSRIVDYVDDLARITSEKERIVAELQLASKIQNAMLPSTFPAFPDRTDFDLHASMVPAKDIGGDFYGFFLIDPDHLALLIADVSGKGIPAALFMMASVITISDRAAPGATPAEILTAANNAVCKSNRSGMFVTVWMGILDLRTGKMTCANAGHEYPMIRHNGVFSVLKDPHGLVIGGYPKVKYRDYEIQLDPGDAVYVYTDGVPEASDPANAFYGTERLLQALNANAAGTPKAILDAVSEDVNRFAAGAEQFDDITMLCVEYKGPSAT